MRKANTTGRSFARAALVVSTLVLGGACPGRQGTTGRSSSMPASPVLASLREGACDIVVESLVTSRVMRGRPASSRARERTLDPETARRFEEESLVDRHLVCTYQVGLGQDRASFDYVAYVGPIESAVAPSRCEAHETALAAARAFGDRRGCRGEGAAGMSASAPASTDGAGITR